MIDFLKISKDNDMIVSITPFDNDYVVTLEKNGYSSSLMFSYSDTTSIVVAPVLTELII